MFPYIDFLINAWLVEAIISKVQKQYKIDMHLQSL